MFQHKIRTGWKPAGPFPNVTQRRRFPPPRGGGITAAVQSAKASPWPSTSRRKYLFTSSALGVKFFVDATST